MASLQALIWDVDGTLADTERHGHREAFNAAFRDMGLDWHWPEDLYGELLEVTGGKERIRHYLRLHRPDFTPPGDLERFVAEMHTRKTAHFVSLLERGRIPLRPGVERVLRQAREAGLPLAIATTTSPANVETLLEANLGREALDWFRVIGAGDVVPRKKPAPDIYHYVLEHLGLPPGACLAIEDSRQGLTAAREAGMPVLVTVNAYTAGDPLDGALAVLDRLGTPERPCRALHGPAPESGMVDLDWLRALTAQA
ncbi:HAD family hydrolase [Ectothiorhodospira mobilis]|uniref:HAD family hydrolase n=1 Tax=Ectothiorhodospira mobilis TaxID=195064 RepID=UPI00190548E4|nr:HAD family hydrolase [Ectothiorhodospira mobilis]MBK1692540.1 phosphatase [Ectothiorhodospira mobilis]